MIKTENGKIIAKEVECAKSLLQKSIGLMFRINPPDALVFTFNKERERNIHTFFVFFDLQVIFLDSENKIKKTKKLRAYRDITKGKAKKIVEIPYKNNKKCDNILKKDEKLIFTNKTQKGTKI